MLTDLFFLFPRKTWRLTARWRTFPQSVKLNDGETVILAWATYKSRKHRDQVMAKVMKDPAMSNYDLKTLPFDGKRMFWGGFKQLVAM
jgi:uncharacterized protein YbaA (DUF1428 family)